jgi:hypothetical protein
MFCNHKNEKCVWRNFIGVCTYVDSDMCDYNKVWILRPEYQHTTLFYEDNSGSGCDRCYYHKVSYHQAPDRDDPTREYKHESWECGSRWEIKSKCSYGKSGYYALVSNLVGRKKMLEWPQFIHEDDMRL